MMLRLSSLEGAESGVARENEVYDQFFIQGPDLFWIVTVEKKRGEMCCFVLILQTERARASSLSVCTYFGPVLEDV